MRYHHGNDSGYPFSESVTPAHVAVLVSHQWCTSIGVPRQHHASHQTRPIGTPLVLKRALEARFANQTFGPHTKVCRTWFAAEFDKRGSTDQHSGGGAVWPVCGVHKRGWLRRAAGRAAFCRPRRPTVVWASGGTFAPLIGSASSLTRLVVRL